MKSAFFLRAGLLVAAAVVLSACATHPPLKSRLRSETAAPPEVSLSDGRVRGVRQNDVDAFLAIPYAAPPVGVLRWRPPQPVTPWSGVYDATHFRHDCMQKAFPFDAAPLKTTFSEDCLTLNVWRPADFPRAGKAPVMVWIHGGGFVNGGTSSPTYNGAYLAAKGVVFVSMNYRLGRFGFFGFPALSAEYPGELKGNYGYMDQIAALKWVRANIAAFGGDPENVTVFGESAGGGSVLTLLTSPLAQGLFARAGVESGGGRSALMGPRLLTEDKPGLPSLESAGVRFAQAHGISGTGADALAKLRALPAGDICDGLNMLNMNSPTYGGPIIDGRLVVAEPDAAFAAGNMAKVPLIIGANSADLGFPDADTMAAALKPFGRNAAKAKKLYDPENSDNAALVANRIAADKMMVEPARFVARQYAEKAGPTFAYRFSYVSPSAKQAMETGPMAKFIVNHGAQHASEIPYIFDTIRDVEGDALDPRDQEMADAMSRYWLNFARTGTPDGVGLPHWPAYDTAQDVIMHFTADGPQAMADPWRERLDLIAGLAQSSVKKKQVRKQKNTDQD